MTAVVVEQIVAKSVGIQIAHGSLELAAARTPIVPSGGSMVTAEALIARKRTIAFEAEPPPRLSFESSLIAFSPKGVAAFAMPSMFDAMFMTIAPMAGWSGGISGNSRRVSGVSVRATMSRSPASNTTRMSPRKKTMTPTSPITSCTALFALEKSEPMTSESCSGPFRAATSSAVSAITSQMALSIGPPGLVAVRASCGPDSRHPERRGGSLLTSHDCSLAGSPITSPASSAHPGAGPGTSSVLGHPPTRTMIRGIAADRVAARRGSARRGSRPS